MRVEGLDLLHVLRYHGDPCLGGLLPKQKGGDVLRQLMAGERKDERINIYIYIYIFNVSQF